MKRTKIEEEISAINFLANLVEQQQATSSLLDE